MSNGIVTTSAPGKLMLLGEHAVVYGYPCIVTAIDKRIRLTIEKLTIDQLRITAPDVGVKNYIQPIGEIGRNLRKETAFIETAVAIWKEKYGLRNGLSIETRADFSSQYGFGSSSAVTVAVLYGLIQIFEKKISQKELFDLCYQVVLQVQKKGSGFDVASAIYGRTTFFQNGQCVILNSPALSEAEGIQDPKTVVLDSRLHGNDKEEKMPKQVRHDDFLPLIVGYTGVKADTVTQVGKVKERRKSREGREQVDEIFQEIREIVENAKNLMKNGTKETEGTEETQRVFGKLMNENQRLLEKLGVSSQKLDSLIAAARNAGAYGAKLSGAGGGDCMIALVPEEKRQAVEDAIEQAGGQVLKVKPNAEGVRVEK